MEEVSDIALLQEKILKLEKELTFQKKSQNQLLNFLHISSLLLVKTNNEDDILNINDSFSLKTGFVLNELSGKKLSTLLADSLAENQIQGFAIENQVEFRRTCLKKKNGDCLNVKIIHVPFKDVEEFKVWVLSENDSDEQVNKSQLTELIQSKDKLLSVLSHDLKGPFGSVLGLTDLVLDNFDEYPSEELRKIIQLVNSSASYAIELIENMINWGRAQTGRIIPLASSVLLGQLVNECIGTLKDQCENKNVTIKNGIHDSVKLYADASWTKIVFKQLLGNAIKFSSPGSEIDVSVEIVNDHALIKVQDRGIGINASDMQKLFDVKSKFVMPGTSGEKGSGLGLLVCKEFIKKQGGEFWLESEEGNGTLVKFTLPLFS